MSDLTDRVSDLIPELVEDLVDGGLDESAAKELAVAALRTLLTPEELDDLVQLPEPLESIDDAVFAALLDLVEHLIEAFRRDPVKVANRRAKRARRKAARAEGQHPRVAEAVYQLTEKLAGDPDAMRLLLILSRHLEVA